MNSFSIADELDQAVSHVLAGTQTGVNADLEIGELAELAGELRDLPEPAFKAQLRARLTGQNVEVHVASSAKRETEIPQQILPTLTGASVAGYPLHQRSMAASLFMHVTALALIVVVGVFANHKSTPVPLVTTMVLTLPFDYPLPPATTAAHGGGGGGDHDFLKASKGAPPRFAVEQLTPPQVVVRNTQPILPAEPTVLGPPEVTFPKDQMGDMLSKSLVPSNGTGIGGGIGDGRGTGVGSGNGAGVGPGYDAGIGGGPYSPGGGVSAPRPIYSPEPEYSEEARRAKFQGDVLLSVVIGPDGIPRDIRVQNSVGMGLDQKAIETVRSWRFEPGKKDGQAVPVRVGIQVNFRLY